MYKWLLILAMGVLFSACTSKMPINLVPLPRQEDIIRTFFNLIDEKRVPEAIAMMSDKAVPNEEMKQLWAVQFNNFDSVKIGKIENSIEANLYKVELTVKVNPRAINEPIPYYGYSDKTEIRFIKLIKDDQKQWKIEGISTGP